MKITNEMLNAFNNYNHTRLYEKLADIRDNFDDYFDEGEAFPILSEVFDNSLSIIKGCDDNSLASWTIEPFSNGTVMLVSKNKDSVINIGVNKYSCSMVIDGTSVNKNPTKLDISEVVSLILKYYICNTYKINVVRIAPKSKSQPIYDFNISSRYATI